MATTKEALERELAVSSALAELSAALVRSGTSLAEIAGIVLEHGKSLTESADGYVGSIDDDTGDFLSHTLTEMMGGECTIEGRDNRFPVGPDGCYGALWGYTLNTKTAFYTNDPPSHKASKGLPEGHIPLRNFMSVPAIVKGRLLGQIALGNAPGGYDAGDLAAVSRLAELYALYLERVLAEERTESMVRFPEENPNPVLRVSRGGDVIYANKPAAELIGSLGFDGAGPLPGTWRRKVADAFETLEAVHLEEQSGGKVWSLTITPVPGADCANIYGMDVTATRRATELVRSERDFTAAILDSTETLVIAVDRDGRIRRFNRACERLTGYSFSEVKGKPYFDLLLVPERVQTARRAFQDLAEGVYQKNSVEYWRARDGSLRLIEWSSSVIADDAGDIRFVVGTGIDVTHHRQMEAYHALTAQLLEELNRPNRGRETLATVTSLIRSVTGFEAVGLRLRKGLDFPYYVTDGFPARFIETERHLCKQGADGKAAVDSNGEVVLECVCGNVLRGTVDPAKPFYTAGGSFWTNNSSRLAQEYTADDFGTEIRGTCIEAGYESVALVPIKADLEIVGLLQLNDRRQNRFTLTIIQFLEQIGASIGMALKRQRADEALRELNETLEERVTERTAALQRRAVQLRALAAELTNVEQRERKRLSGILHDHVQQLLVAAKMKAALLRKNAAADIADLLSQIDDLLQDSIDSCRSLAIELSPPILHDAGLPEALEWLAWQMREKHGLEICLEIDELASPRDENTAILIYHAVRELLLNIVKHAQVKQAHLRLQRREGMLCAAVKDSGIGFDPAHAPADHIEVGLGLFSIRERLEAAGGKMHIESAAEKGTTVTLSVPAAAAGRSASRAPAGGRRSQTTPQNTKTGRA